MCIHDYYYDNFVGYLSYVMRIALIAFTPTSLAKNTVNYFMLNSAKSNVIVVLVLNDVYLEISPTTLDISSTIRAQGIT